MWRVGERQVAFPHIFWPFFPNDVVNIVERLCGSSGVWLVGKIVGKMVRRNGRRHPFSTLFAISRVLIIDLFPCHGLLSKLEHAKGSCPGCLVVGLEMHTT